LRITPWHVEAVAGTSTGPAQLESISPTAEESLTTRSARYAKGEQCPYRLGTRHRSGADRLAGTPPSVRAFSNSSNSLVHVSSRRTVPDDSLHTPLLRTYAEELASAG